MKSLVFKGKYFVQKYGIFILFLGKDSTAYFSSCFIDIKYICGHLIYSNET